MSIANFFTIKEFTGKHMLIVLSLFFGTIICVNLVLTWFAFGSWSGLVAKNGYVASIDFEEQQKRVEDQAKLGWNSRLKLEKGKLFFSLKDAQGKSLQALSISAVLQRPTTEKADKIVNFSQVQSGTYAIKAPDAPGLWVIDITATTRQNKNSKVTNYRKIFRFVVKPAK